MSEELEHGDIEAALATRKELGASYDAALVDSFADRVEREIQRRVDTELTTYRRAQKASASAGPRQLALGIITLVAAIPITIVVGGVFEQTIALLAALLTLLGVNWAHAWQSKGR